MILLTKIQSNRERKELSTALQKQSQLLLALQKCRRRSRTRSSDLEHSSREPLHSGVAFNYHWRTQALSVVGGIRGEALPVPNKEVGSTK